MVVDLIAFIFIFNVLPGGPCACACCCAVVAVIIIAVDGSVIMIPDGSVLVDKVVTGNLRILDH